MAYQLLITEGGTAAATDILDFIEKIEWLGKGLVTLAAEQYNEFQVNRQLQARFDRMQAMQKRSDFIA